MIAAGTSVDIVTGRPSAKRPKEEIGGIFYPKQTEADLTESAKNASLIESDSGKALVSMIEKLLQARIEFVLRDDPEAMAYMNILFSLGVETRRAKVAAEKLLERHLGKRD